MILVIIPKVKWNIAIMNTMIILSLHSRSGTTASEAR